MKPYLTLEHAAEVAQQIREELTTVSLLPEEYEQLLAMALDAPLLCGRLERATWSAFIAGADWGRAHTEVKYEGLDSDIATAVIGSGFDRHDAWRRAFLAEDEKREDAPAALVPPDVLRGLRATASSVDINNLNHDGLYESACAALTWLKGQA